MTGLLEKDILILVKQKKLFIIYLASAIMLSFAMDSSFVVSYFTMIGSLLVLSTLSYDSFDNGLSFLMTLPACAKTYAREKYVFSVIGLLCSWIAGVAAQFISLLLQKQSFDAADLISMDLAFIPIFLIIVSLMLPINLKFGPEKGRIILIIIIAIVMGIGLLGKKLILSLLKDPNQIDLEYWMLKIQSIPQSMIVLAGYGISILFFFITMAISVGIMNKKEF